MSKFFTTELEPKGGRKIPLAVALIPVVFLIAGLSFNVLVLGSDPLDGPSQLILLLSSCLTALLASFYGTKWDEMLGGAARTLADSVGALIILLSIGMLAGAWMLGGIIPSFIHYGLYILRPEWFLPAALIISALVSLATGSSWTTIATIGVAVLGMGTALGINPAMTAGAIISGAYFGDKVSPLSDTTNLASASCEVPLGTHISYMIRTTIPTFVLTLLIFTLISIVISPGNNAESEAGATLIQGAISSVFSVNPLIFLVPTAVIVMIALRFPIIPTLVVASLLGLVSAIIFQQPLLHCLAEKNSCSVAETVIRCLYTDNDIHLGNPALDGLLSTSGMKGMLNTVWLVIMSMTFGGMMEASGFISVITAAIIRKIQSTTSTVTATVLVCLLLNIVVADQYLTLVLSGKIFKDSYNERKLPLKLLSRSIEDGGTVTSVLIPWNSCGATQAGILGVATLSYLPFAFFCYLSPIMTIIFAITGLWKKGCYTSSRL